METKELRHKRLHTTRRAVRTRTGLRGTTQRPRLSAHISLMHVSAQLIDDSTGRTLVSVTTEHEKSLKGKSLTEKATWVGEQIGTQAKKAKHSTVVFDRGAKRYHGRVAALAEAARKSGLEF